LTPASGPADKHDSKPAVGTADSAGNTERFQVTTLIGQAIYPNNIGLTEHQLFYTIP
jgi:hypothetical protein